MVVWAYKQDSHYFPLNLLQPWGVHANRRSNRISVDFNLQFHISQTEQANFNLKSGTLYQTPNYLVGIALYYLITLKKIRNRSYSKVKIVQPISDLNELGFCAMRRDDSIPAP